MAVAVLLSVPPKDCALIAQGEKTILVLKACSKFEPPVKGYIYCMQGDRNSRLLRAKWAGHIIYASNLFCPYLDDEVDILNGKVMGEFVCDEIDVYPYGDLSYPTPAYDGDPSMCECGDGYWITNGELDQTCLTYDEFLDYGKGKTIYVLHISDLKIYDNPKNILEFNHICKKGYAEAGEQCFNCRYAFKGLSTGTIYCDRAVSKAPSTFCYVEELED